MSSNELQKTMKLFEQICPGITDEIQGFADEVAVDVSNIIYYYAYIRPAGGQCSLISISPKASQDRGGMLARNYEFAWDDLSILIDSALEGQYRQIGFGCQLFGKFDGINEHGLCIATAADYRNYIIMDAEGNSALIEAAALNYVIKKSEYESIPFLFATNHYESQQLRQQGFYTPNHSKLRFHIIKDFLQKSNERLSNTELKKLLELPMPDGICCHYYEDGMGTMWPMIFHPKERTVEVCFGVANNNGWRTVSLCEEEEADGRIKEYEVILHNEKAPAKFWKENDEI